MDIAMCGSKECPMRGTCYRNPASGTKPDPMRQSWIYWGVTTEHGCDAYWHNFNKVTKTEGHA